MLFLFITSCEDNNLGLTQSKEKSSYKFKKVSLSDLPEIKSYLKSKNDNLFYKVESKIEGAIFDSENILETIDTLQRANYSFYFTYPDTPEGTFYNLVIGKTEDGEIKEPYVLKYTSDESHLEEFIHNKYDFNFFTGKIGVYKYTDFFESDSFYKGEEVCPPEYDAYGDPITCTDIEVNNGQNGGGGSSGGDGGISDGGSTPGTGGTGTGGGSEIVCYKNVTSCWCEGYNVGVHDHEPTVVTWDCYVYDKNKGETEICPECPIDSNGGVGVNTTTTTQKIDGILGNTLNNDQLSWLSNPDHSEEESETLKFLAQNNNEEGKAFTELAINTWMDNSELDLNSFNLFSEFIPDYKGRMTDEEIAIFDAMSIKNQTRYLFNAQKASEKASELFPGVQRNTKADAFRHSYFHSLNTYYINFELSELLGDAHEINTPNELILEKTMDLFNNQIGRNLSQSPPILMNGYGTLVIRVYDALQNGDLVYLNPLNTDGAINSNTQLINTNQ